MEEGFGCLWCSFFAGFGEVFYTTLVCGYADGKAFDVDELRLRLDESDDVGWNWLKLDVPKVKVPFVEHSSGRCPVFVWKAIE